MRKKKKKLTSNEYEKMIKNIKINHTDNIRDIYDNSINHNDVNDRYMTQSNIDSLLIADIRHRLCSEYNHNIKRLYSIPKEERQYYYMRYKNAVLFRIAKEYPFLGKKCSKLAYNVPLVKNIMEES